MQTLDDVKKRIKLLLAESKFDKVFKLFNEALNDDSDAANVIISLQGQYNSMNHQVHQNLVENDFAERTFNRIRIALTTQVDKLEEGDLKPGFLNGQISTPASPISDLDDELRKGIQRQLDISLKRLSSLREAYAIQFDPNIKFTLQLQIENLETEINELKMKLGV